MFLNFSLFFIVEFFSRDEARSIEVCPNLSFILSIAL